MTMVERVAAAIDPSAWADDLPVPTRADTEAFHRRRQASAKLARAAILAMREPDEAMKQAGMECLMDGSNVYGCDDTVVFETLASRDTWQAMMKAALAEEKKDG
jgi:hypothetical protein